MRFINIEILGLETAYAVTNLLKNDEYKLPKDKNFVIYNDSDDILNLIHVNITAHNADKNGIFSNYYECIKTEEHVIYSWTYKDIRNMYNELIKKDKTKESEYLIETFGKLPHAYLITGGK